MNPAPPVTRIMHPPCGAEREPPNGSQWSISRLRGARILSRGPVVLAVPIYEARQPFSERRRRLEAGCCGKAFNRREGCGNVTRLQRQVLLDRATAEQGLQATDEHLQLDRG